MTQIARCSISGCPNIISLPEEEVSKDFVYTCAACLKTIEDVDETEIETTDEEPESEATPATLSGLIEQQKKELRKEKSEAAEADEEEVVTDDESEQASALPTVEEDKPAEEEERADRKSDSDRQDAFTESASTSARRVVEFGHVIEEGQRVDIPGALFDLECEEFLIQVLRYKLPSESAVQEWLNKRGFIRAAPASSYAVSSENRSPDPKILRTALAWDELFWLEQYRKLRLAYEAFDALGAPPPPRSGEKRLPPPPSVFVNLEEVNTEQKENLRLFFDLKRQQLVQVIKDERFQKRLREEPTHRHVKWSKIYEKLDTMLTKKEAQFYIDFVKNKIPVGEVIENKDHILNIEERIVYFGGIRGIIGAAPNSERLVERHDDSEQQEDRFPTLEAAFQAALRLHGGRRRRAVLTGSMTNLYEPLNTFRPAPPKVGGFVGSGGPGDDGDGGKGTDDASGDSDDERGD